jgi:hypothetical protein
MNGKVKFHPAKSPAFNEGEVWVDSTGRKVEIIDVQHFGDGKFDGQVFYKCDIGSVYNKDVWNFQVRYTHQADLAL